MNKLPTTPIPFTDVDVFTLNIESELYLLIALLFLMLLSNRTYENNYWLQGFWILGVTWYGIHIMVTIEFIVLPLVCIIYTIIVNIFLIEKNINRRR